MFEIATDTALLLGLAAFCAGFIDSIAGGGGLISVPALLLAGLSPIEALATNKWQSLWGSGSATITYASKGYVDLRAQLPFALLSALGGAIGAYVTTLLPLEWLQLFLPILLIAIALYFALKPNFNDVDRLQRMTPALFGATIVPAIGFYDGIFGPGTGSFFMLSLVALLGFGLLKATAHTKLLNFASNIGSFAVFIFAGAVFWKIGLLMGAAQFVGARLGATVAMRVGSGLIKPLLITACLALAVKLLLDPSNPLRAMIGF
ncbi:MAG: TSUP family transporter [Rhizobiaceae bacterium]|nr:TSUP family transporter [Rhizobiaceae bacterium]